MLYELLHTPAVTDAQAEVVDRLLMIRQDMRDLRAAFMATAREARESGLSEDSIVDALLVDSARRGEAEGWAHLDSVLVAEVRL